MYIKKTKGLLAIFGLVVLLSTGCSNKDVEDALKDSVPLGVHLASNDANAWVTAGIEDIGDRIKTIMDTEGYYIYDNLEPAKSSEEMKLTDRVNKINMALVKGEVTDSFITDGTLKYILHYMDYFGKYVYELKEIDIVGVDRDSEHYVVDVTYTASSVLKANSEVPDIVKGDPTESLKKRLRLERYVSDILLKTGKGSDKAWGVYTDETPIYSYQDEVKQVERGVLGINYSKRNIEQVDNSAAYLKFRYIFALSPMTLDLALESAYLIEYSGGEIKTALRNTELFTDNTKINLSNFVESFYKALNTRNYIGLYKLMAESGRYEPYLDSMFNDIYKLTTSTIKEFYSRDGDTLVVTTVSEVKDKSKDKKIGYGVYGQEDILTIKWRTGGFVLVDIEPLKVVIKKEPSLFQTKENLYLLEEFELISGADNTETKKDIEQFLLDLSTAMVGDSGIVSFIDKDKSLVETEKIRKTLQSVSEVDKKYTLVEEWIYATSLTCEVRLREVIISNDKAYNIGSRMKLQKVQDKWMISDYNQSVFEEVLNDFGADYFNNFLEMRVGK